MDSTSPYSKQKNFLCGKTDFCWNTSLDDFLSWYVRGESKISRFIYF